MAAITDDNQYGAGLPSELIEMIGNKAFPIKILASFRTDAIVPGAVVFFPKSTYAEAGEWITFASEANGAPLFMYEVDGTRTLVDTLPKMRQRVVIDASNTDSNNRTPPIDITDYFGRQWLLRFRRNENPTVLIKPESRQYQLPQLAEYDYITYYMGIRCAKNLLCLALTNLVTNQLEKICTLQVADGQVVVRTIIPRYTVPAGFRNAPDSYRRPQVGIDDHGHVWIAMFGSLVVFRADPTEIDLDNPSNHVARLDDWTKFAYVFAIESACDGGVWIIARQLVNSRGTVITRIDLAPVGPFRGIYPQDS
jgi:hypothetical protein